MKIKSLSQLSSALDQEIGWRIQEISFLKRAASKSGDEVPRALIRASIPITYAHWEGFVKSSSCYYLEYVSSQVPVAGNLRNCFLGLMFKNKMDEVKKSVRSFSLWQESIDMIESVKSSKTNLKLKPKIENIGNLDFHTFREISLVCGVSTLKYETKQKFIDETLVAQRNYIAHGDQHFPSFEEISSVSDTCIDLLREYKTDLENGAAQKLYLKP